MNTILQRHNYGSARGHRKKPYVYRNTSAHNYRQRTPILTVKSRIGIVTLVKRIFTMTVKTAAVSARIFRRIETRILGCHGSIDFLTVTDNYSSL
ncbi:hypothetical protein Y032_0027g1594 [Ancylostoma ceylanicum]|uniref:Uncharacterized protein n=1 Tax=Ancylostoma ceylanicum TaxID=53326 RepID=A0A016UUE7_9BILA|nr:hypothetical protein Y032_0027g1594 [Ancylostoma ceylanicum]